MGTRADALASAKALLAAGEAAAAAVQLRAALRDAPAWGRGWLLLGQCHARLGDHDAAAVSFRRAGSSSCDDDAPALAMVAGENAELCASRILPRHFLAWLNDEERAHAWRTALQAALRDREGCGVLCSGTTAACSVLHAALALEAGAARATAVCGSHLAAGVAGSLDVRLAAVAELPAPPAGDAAGAQPFDLLAWDFGNRLDAKALEAFRAARRACGAHARVLPTRVRVRAAIVECAALLELNAVEEVRITQRDVSAAGGVQTDAADCVLQLRSFAQAYTRATRAVQLQAPSLQPWRVLTEPVTLLSLDTAGGDLEEVCAPAPVVAAGCGHAVVTWLEVEGLGAPLCTAPPELSRGTALGPLAAVHAVQFATFAPLGAPWRLAAGETRRLRGAVTPSGVDVSLQAPLACQVAGPHAHSAPDYHASMLNDTRRNAAYAAGLAHAVASHRLRSGGAPPRVLDIGAGAGLLSMLAARTGAADVLACERDAALARCAAADVEANGLGAAITVAAAHSRDLGRHNAGAFDVIVQEVFGSDALSEGVLPTLAHAGALLATGGVMVPARLRVRAALVCSGALRAVLGTARAGRDSDDLPARAVAAYDALAPLRCSCHLPDVAGAALLTDAAEFVLDLCARPLPQQGALTAHARGVHAGEADAVLFWFAACFDGGAQCATGPADGRRQHWQQTLFRLPAPRRVALGDAVALQMRYCADRTSWAVLDA